MKHPEMKHPEMKELLVLSLYDELGQGEEFLLQGHLQECADCRVERDRLAEFRQVTTRVQGAPPEELLQKARRDLWQGVESASQPSSTTRPEKPGWADWFRQLVLAPATVGGLAMLAIGLVGGHLIFRGTAPGVPEIEYLPDNVANVRFLEPDASGAGIEVVYDQVQPVRMRGRANDQEMLRLLSLAAVRGLNAGVRLKAVEELDNRQGGQGDAEVKRTLISALRGDENPGVRRRVFEALQRLPLDEEIRGAFLDVLRFDPNPGMRVAVINRLEEAAMEGLSMDDGLIEELRDRVTSDQNDYVRIRSESFLRQVASR